ncbi:MAG: Bacterial type II secretion system protein F domain protein [Pelotomaculum sp. PtaB.Bin104]|nr:MAG: Bacterial type II secretion system protein F domain protein [Pelotomaculum sp. PtaB.Bin104]
MKLSIMMLIPSVLVALAIAAIYIHKNREMFIARYKRLQEELESAALSRDTLFSNTGAPKNAEFKLYRLGYNVSYRYFLALNIVIGLILAVASVALLNNPKLAVLSVAVWMLLVHKLLDMAYEKKVKQPMAEQVEIVLQLLAEAYETTKDLVEAFVEVFPTTRYPLKNEIELMIKDNNLGKDINACLIEFAERLDNRDIESFVRGIILSAHYGTDTYEVLKQTAEIVRERRELKEELINETKGKNATIMIFLLAVPVVLFYLLATSASARSMFLNTHQGQNLMCVVLVVEFICWYFSKMKEVSEKL